MSFGAFATLLVAAGFVWLLVRVLHPGRRSQYESYAAIPFADDEPAVNRDHEGAHDE
jgi:hypothetical protein